MTSRRDYITHWTSLNHLSGRVIIVRPRRGVCFLHCFMTLYHLQNLPTVQAQQQVASECCTGRDKTGSRRGLF